MDIPTRLELIAVRGLPAVRAGDDLAGLVAERLAAQHERLHEGDVVVFAQKVVSKSEGRAIDLSSVTASARAEQLAREVGKDARLVEVILSEARRIVRHRKDVLIVEHRLGFVMANAGVDQSNVASAEAGELALLLPENPDASARRLRIELSRRYGCPVGVVVSDSFGRPWRRGSTGVAIGCSGLPALIDLRGRPDLFGRTLRVTEVGLADEVASAASLLMGQADEALPVIVVRGLQRREADTPARTLIRPAEEDLFR